LSGAPEFFIKGDELFKGLIEEFLTKGRENIPKRREDEPLQLRKISDYLQILVFGEKPVAMIIVNPKTAKVHIVAKEDADVMVTRLN
jgi:hypothetical protein